MRVLAASTSQTKLTNPGHVLTQPRILAYTAQDFGSELKSRLSCLLDGQTVLERCIDATVEVMEKRLDATQELINSSQQLEK